ncbi:MAG: metallophosphoesterase family protein [Syntrophales bacterium]|nr:metallophosphoesterase family protein [Syntrophales bacterium]
MERIFAIGDIHGCFDMLEELLDMIPMDRRRDRLLFIGDYIDRGARSREVVDLIIDLKRRNKKVTCLMGNHEEMLMNYIDRPDEDSRTIFFQNGGRATATSYGYRGGKGDEIINVPQQHREFFKSLLPIYETEEYIFVHAGLRPKIEPSKQNRKDLLWIRNEFIHSSFDFGKTVVFGHTPFSYPFLEDHKIGIDTGAVYGGSLTCIELPSRVIYQV